MKTKSDKAYCSISFDDGLQSVYQHAYPLLKDQKIPFTVFLNTSVVGNNDLLWLHVLGYLFSELGVHKTVSAINSQIDTDKFRLLEDSKPGDVEVALRKHIEYFHDNEILARVVQTHGLDLTRIANDECNYLTWSQIVEMADNDGTFYSHTHKHLPLRSISKIQTVMEEIDVARNILLKKQTAWGRYISFPFGMEVDYGQKARDYALQKAGHEFVVEVGNGVNSSSRITNQRMISRVGLGAVSAKEYDIYTAIEIRPVVKHTLKKLLGKR